MLNCTRILCQNSNDDDWSFLVNTPSATRPDRPLFPGSFRNSRDGTTHGFHPDLGT